ncbi:MAG: hypothetical protein ACRCUM_02375 [Mycoplasmoidaceae bacterium]
MNKLNDLWYIDNAMNKHWDCGCKLCKQIIKNYQSINELLLKHDHKWEQQISKEENNE